MDKSKPNALYQSKHAPKPPAGQPTNIKKPYDPNGLAHFIATTKMFGKPDQTPATPKSLTVPYLATSLAAFSSSPASSEVVTPNKIIIPEKTLARRASFKEGVHQAAAEAFKAENDIKIANSSSPAQVKLATKENELPVSALPYTLRSSSLKPSPPQTPVTDTMAGPKLTSSASATNIVTSTMASTGMDRIAEIRRRVMMDKAAKDPLAPQQAAEAKAKRLEDVKEQEAQKVAEQAKLKAEAAREQAAKEKPETARLQAEHVAKEKANAARLEAERLGKENMEAARLEGERLAMEKTDAAAKEAERIAKKKAEASRKEAERVAKEKMEAERLAKEKAAAEAKLKAEKQKVIDTTEAQCKSIIAKIDSIKAAYSKQKKEGLEELEAAEQLIAEVETDKKEITDLLKEAIAEVAQAQTKVENLNRKASNLEEALTETKKIVDDKKQEMADMEKAGKAQVAALETEMKEMVQKLDQLLKEVADTTKDNVDAAVAEKATDKVAPQTNGQANGKTNGQVNGQINGQVNDKTNGKVNGHINGSYEGELYKPLDEPFKANPTMEERAAVKTEGKLTFDAWPQVAAGREGLEVRRVKLSNLPSTATLKNVASLVWGGVIQEFIFTPGKPEAEVLFVNPAECKKYFDATPNGIKYPGQPDRYITVEPCAAESARGNVKEIVEKGMTRCVRVMDLESDWTKLALNKVAAGMGGKRAVESVPVGKSMQGRRIADFRFGKVADAVIFKAELARDENWEPCVFSFGEDPCAKHTAVHDGKM